MPLRTLAQVRPIIRQHHELLDGTGYPDRLRGSAIALTSQIVAFVDVYDALTSDRPYRKALASATALEMLEDACRAGQRDRALFELFSDEMTMGLNLDTLRMSPDAVCGVTSRFPGGSRRVKLRAECPRTMTNQPDQMRQRSFSTRCRSPSTRMSC